MEQKVDVAAMIEEIRQEADANRAASPALDFDDLKYTAEMEELYPEYVFDPAELERRIGDAKRQSRVNWYHAPEGNPIAVFIKKVIIKLAGFLVIPPVEDQNHYNESVCVSLDQLMACIDEQHRTNEELKKRIAELERKLEEI